MPKAIHFVMKHDDGSIAVEQIHIFCKACGFVHAISPKVHTFNGNFDKPTFTPSLLCNFGGALPVCHSYVTDGMIQYLGDCTHDLKNQTVELPEFPDEHLPYEMRKNKE